MTMGVQQVLGSECTPLQPLVLKLPHLCTLQYFVKRGTVGVDKWRKRLQRRCISVEKGMSAGVVELNDKCDLHVR